MEVVAATVGVANPPAPNVAACVEGLKVRHGFQAPTPLRHPRTMLVPIEEVFPGSAKPSDHCEVAVPPERLDPDKFHGPYIPYPP